MYVTVGPAVLNLIELWCVVLKLNYAGGLTNRQK
jgi:hypothetical protein